MSSILDQLRSGAGKAAFEADKLRKITSIKSEIRSLKNDAEAAFLRVGHVAFRLHQAGNIDQPELNEACVRIDALHAQIGAYEREIEEIREQSYQPPTSVPQYGHLCPNGHGELPAGARFCPRCGAQGIHVSPPTPGVACPACGADLAPESRFCPSCGTPIPEPAATPSGLSTSTTCSSCGAPLVPEARFCPDCGTPVPEPWVADVESEAQDLEEYLVPPEGPDVVACPACGVAVAPEARFCPECGVSIPVSPSQAEGAFRTEAATESPPAAKETVEEVNVCPGCGTALFSEALFCPECGQQLGEMEARRSETGVGDEDWPLGAPEP